MFETGLYRARQIDLRYVAGYHGAGIVPDTCQKHLHLLNGRVLRFIQNYECVIQRAAPHEREGRKFDCTTVQQPSDTFGTEHVVKRIVQRTQIRIDFLLNISRQKSNSFACFHHRPDQNDSTDRIVGKRVSGTGDRKVGFSGTRRSNSNGNGFGRDAFQVCLLGPRTRANIVLADFQRNNVLKFVVRLETGDCILDIRCPDHFAVLALCIKLTQ